MRARALCAPVFLSSLPPQTGRCAPPTCPPQLRCFSFDPQKYIKSIQLGPPTFFPLDHMQTEEAMKYEALAPAPVFRFLYGFWIFSFCYSLLFIFFLFISFYPSVLISSLPFFVFLFFSLFLYFKLLYYRHEISVILRGFSRGSSLC